MTEQSASRHGIIAAGSKTRPPLANREFGMLHFNERVLSMAQSASVPLLERLRFICIVSSNLDEFFEVRVAGLRERLRQRPHVTLPDGTTVAQLLPQLSVAVHELVTRQYALLNQSILPALAEQGVRLHLADLWTPEQRAWAKTYFHREVKPILTPIGLDPAHPFPRVYNKSLNFIVSLSGRDAFDRNASIAIVQAPRALPRLVPMPAELSGGAHGFVLLSSFLQAFVGEIFPGLTINGCYQFRVTRNSDLFVDDEEITNLKLALQGELPLRHFGDAVRLEISKAMPEELSDFLMREFGLSPDDCYSIDGPVNLSRLAHLVDVVDLPNLKFLTFTPRIAPALADVLDHPSQFFATLTRQDVLLHHPYESFQPVIAFLAAACADPDVVAIRHTIYRTGEDSALMSSLLRAAQAGKEVTVVVELMARFDEQTNIHWAAKLEEVGAHVVYGVVGHKTHAKMALVLRREENRLRRYAHLGTGNYHSRTALSYTDFGLFTADVRICEDVERIFQQLTGLGTARRLKCLLQAPFTLHTTMLEAIARETQHARSGRPALIQAKMNALLEPDIIQALYEASAAGVKIDLIIRGVCALRPGIADLSANIRVFSVIGRFLEHSRVFHFLNGGRHDVYIASADWMDRNFFRRVEVAVPVLDAGLKSRVLSEAIDICLKHPGSAWLLRPDGRYQPPDVVFGQQIPSAIGTPDHIQQLLLANLSDNGMS